MYRHPTYTFTALPRFHRGGVRSDCSPRFHRGAVRSDCFLDPNGNYPTISECRDKTSCDGGGGTGTYGCDANGNCVTGKGTFDEGKCMCYNCATSKQFQGSPNACTTAQCVNPDGGPCYNVSIAPKGACYPTTGGQCPGGTALCPAAGPVCTMVGNSGTMTQGCPSSTCSTKVCPVAPGGGTCNAHGTCSQTTGVCMCDAGWSGDACTIQKVCPIVGGKVCNTPHGSCDQATLTCNCVGGYSGDNCGTAPACPTGPSGTCDGHGTCDTSTWTCTCDNGWRGSACTISGSTPSPGPAGYPSVTTYWGQRWGDPDFARFTEMPWIGRVIVSFTLPNATSELFRCDSNPSAGLDLGWHGNFCTKYDCAAAPAGRGNTIFNCAEANQAAWEGQAGYPDTYPPTFPYELDAGTNPNAGQPFAKIPDSIKLVQAQGTEVLISLGGALGTLPSSQTGAEYGGQLLDAMRTQFLDKTSGTVRPFGDVVLDGVDLDLEVMTDGPWFIAFLEAWNTEKMGKRSGGGKGMLLTAAPEAAIRQIWKSLLATNADGTLVNLAAVAQIDCFQLQFYNTPYACWACSGSSVSDPSNPTSDGYFGMDATAAHWNTPGSCASCPYSSSQGFSIGSGGSTCMMGNLISYLQLYDSICVQCNTWRKANGYTQLQKFQVGIPAPPTINSISRASDSASMEELYAAMLEKEPAERVTYWSTQFNTAAQKLADIFPLHFGGFMEWDAAGDVGPYFVAAPGTLSGGTSVKPWTGGKNLTIGPGVQLTGLLATAVEPQLAKLPTTMDSWSAKLDSMVHDARFNPGGTC